VNGRAMSRLQAARGYPGNDWLGGITDPPWVKQDSFFERWLSALPGSTVEMSCHPGYPDESLVGRDCDKWDGMLQRRVDELALLWILVCAACCTRAYCFPTQHTVYHNYASAGRAWRTGTDAYEIERDSTGAAIPRMSAYRYAPPVSVLFVPFSMLSDAAGSALWRLVSYACFFGAFAVYVRLVLPGASQLQGKSVAGLWLLLLPLSLGSMNNGQANVLLMALLMGALAAAMAQRWNWSAVLLAGACLIKIYPLALALLMLVVYPRQLGWRFLAALGIGLALPFAFGPPRYVLDQYANWFELLRTDDRRAFPMNQGYRDFYLLARFMGHPLSSMVYLAIQLGTGAMVAGVCLLGRINQWPRQKLLQTLFALGCCWMVVFGPSTESSTFILIAPALAWSLVESFALKGPLWSRGTLVLVMGMFLLTFTATWFPGGRDWFYVLQPLSALLFFIERLSHASLIRSESRRDVPCSVRSIAA
jgi:hypothetical protein